MVDRISIGKSLKAYFLAGIFLSFIAFDVCTTTLLTFESKSCEIFLTKTPAALIVLRDASAENFSHFPPTKTIALGYQIVQSIEVLLEEPVLQPTLLLTQRFRNVFYVYVSSLAP